MPMSPDPDERPHLRPTPLQPGQGTLRIQDFGDEVHLWVEQRVPWTVALQVLKVLKASDPPEGAEAPEAAP